MRSELGTEMHSLSAVAAALSDLSDWIRELPQSECCVQCGTPRGTQLELAVVDTDQAFECLHTDTLEAA